MVPIGADIGISREDRVECVRIDRLDPAEVHRWRIEYRCIPGDFRRFAFGRYPEFLSYIATLNFIHAASPISATAAPASRYAWK